MDLLFLLTTALIVSIDSFISGFSLSAKSDRKFAVLFGISLTVLTLCAATSALGVLLKGILSERVANFGGIILIAIGIYNLFPHEEKQTDENSSIIKQAVFVGIGIGLDGAFANLSLLLIGYNPILVPAIIVGMHIGLISLGTFLSGLIKKTKLGKLKFIPPLLLIALGIYKVICIFI